MLAWPWPGVSAEVEPAPATAEATVTESEPPPLDQFVAATIAEVAFDSEEADFLRDRLASLNPDDAGTILDTLWRHPKFMESMARAEFERRMPAPEVKYPPELLVKLKAEADRQFSVFRKGERITVPDPRGIVAREFSGEYQGIFEDTLKPRGTVSRRKVKIGGRFFILEDFPGEIRDRFDAVAMTREHEAFLQREYHQPRQNYTLAYQDLRQRHLDQARETYRDERRELVRKKVAELKTVAADRQRQP